ncbi:MAG: hypothetical protein QXQ69_00395 [Candidatus Aenigmatarchaeota archaeon]
MKLLLVILFVFLFLLILNFFSSLTAFFPKISPNQRENFYFIGKVKIEEGKIASVNVSVY